MANDSIILAKEGLEYEECYHESFHLSASYMATNFYEDSSHPITIFDHKSLVQWAMFWEPRHPLMLRVLRNLVHVLKFEFYHKSVLIPIRQGLGQYRKVICTTGPILMSSTMREAFLEQEIHKKTNYSLRVVARDFSEYGGLYKAENWKPYTSNHGSYKGSYTYMRHGNVHILERYHQNPQLEGQRN